MSEESIKTCPFCECEEVEILSTHPQAIWIECAHCGGQSFPGESKEEAISNWNTRSTEIKQAKVIRDDVERRLQRSKNVNPV